MEQDFGALPLAPQKAFALWTPISANWKRMRFQFAVTGSRGVNPMWRYGGEASPDLLGGLLCCGMRPIPVDGGAQAGGVRRRNISELADELAVIDDIRRVELVQHL